jgi:hypothetical protein
VMSVLAIEVGDQDARVEDRQSGQSSRSRFSSSGR